jgi:Zn-dependent protease with chaperone function
VNQQNTLRAAVLGAASGLALGYAAVGAAPRPPRPGGADGAHTLTGVVRGIADLAVIAFVVGDPLERALQPLPRLLRAPAFALALSALDAVRELGTSYVEEHALERVYGTSDQSAPAWLADKGKAAAVGAGVSVVLVTLADGVVRAAPRRWPWIAIGALPPLLAFATVFMPTFVMPLFNRYEPVRGDLEKQIRELAARYGVGDAAILRFDMSRQTKKANAFVTGVLGTERIALGDTLIESFPVDETLFVVAHELGHYVRRDPWLGIALTTVSLGATILTAEAVVRRTTGRDVDSPAQGARLAFYAMLLQVALGPAANFASRTIESRADRFAVAATGDAAAGVRAFRRLGEQNLAEFEPPRWAELLLASHPSLASRIRALEHQM